MRVFIAGPYNDTANPKIIARNIERASEAAKALMLQGHLVYCPHVMMEKWGHDSNINREMYLVLDRSFLEHWAQAICRIPGNSPGADMEMNRAQELGLIRIPYPGIG